MMRVVHLPFPATIPPSDLASGPPPPLPARGAAGKPSLPSSGGELCFGAGAQEVTQSSVAGECAATPPLQAVCWRVHRLRTISARPLWPMRTATCAPTPLASLVVLQQAALPNARAEASLLPTASQPRPASSLPLDPTKSPPDNAPPPPIPRRKPGSGPVAAVQEAAPPAPEPAATPAAKAPPVGKPGNLAAPVAARRPTKTFKDGIRPEGPSCSSPCFPPPPPSHPNIHTLLSLPTQLVRP